MDDDDDAGWCWTLEDEGLRAMLRRPTEAAAVVLRRRHSSSSRSSKKPAELGVDGGRPSSSAEEGADDDDDDTGARKASVVTTGRPRKAAAMGRKLSKVGVGRRSRAKQSAGDEATASKARTRRPRWRAAQRMSATECAGGSGVLGSAATKPAASVE